MKKVFVLDTNVLLHDPKAMLSFADNEVVLPITIIEELDRFKKQVDSIGRNARQVSRTLDALSHGGSLVQGITLDQGGLLRVALCKPEILETLPTELAGDSGDNEILAVALTEQNNCQCPVVLVSKDTNLRIKAGVLGLTTEDYETGKVNLDEFYGGTAEVLVDAEAIAKFYQDGTVTLPESFFPNQAVTLVDRLKPTHTALGICRGDEHQVVPLHKATKAPVSNIQARNREQKFALELLLQDEIQLVTLVGKAGTGKTLLALAAGVAKVAGERLYNQLLISRPIVPMGKDLGYLPGEIKEKLTPWMQPLYDNLDLIFNTQDLKDKPRHWRHGYEELMELGLLQIEPLTYIRGRTIPRQILIVDEAQNLTPHEVKTILTRAGEGTKIILTGDVEQIDNPYVDASSNGLTYVVEKFKQEAIAGHITLLKGERSPLAERASILL
ncbi:PhoH family protein [Picosynechococcus sp. PCC 7117]|uniref:PhoH family protein n=1 Tax=Picosynechococcus sp. PCC 7117 TaxID=195498 RepID=UPI000810E756|nr:PhoH family protein [Picosynechococcus sp. PCC 7117]ANV86171.1 phosphate starvation-inducible protein PhoH [Picosynechococcus sp. PCC 7117]